jgi:heme o synthase
MKSRGISDLVLPEDLQGDRTVLTIRPIGESRRSLAPENSLSTTRVPLASGDTHIVEIDRSIFLRRSYANIGGYAALTKPRVMLLVVFTAFVGLMVAPGGIDPFAGAAAVLCIAAGAGAAAALNMWYDADIDAVMARTAMRPIPSGRISRMEALVFGLMLGICAIVALGTLLTIGAAALLAFTILFYVVVYTMWLKRRTPQNIVIGGAAGALPPVIGWVAVAGDVGLEPLILFLIIFLWTPPHFWALSLNLAEDYARAGVPMLPVVAGRAETKRQILLYSVLLAAISFAPWALGFAGAIYGAVAAMLGAIMILLSWQVRRSNDDERRPARRLFVFSMLYLVLLFGVLLMNAAPSGR